MKYPSLYTVDGLVKSQTNPVLKNINGSWVACRSEGYPSLRSRILHSWMVFTGKADVVVWPEGQ